jgi:hypothetical protein
MEENMKRFISKDSGSGDSFIDAGNKLFGCLTLCIMLFVLVANILAFAFSARYRTMIPVGKFVMYTLAWSGLTAGFWWMIRSVIRSKGQSRKR